MPDERPTAPPPADVSRQRAAAQRSLLRANTAVAFALLAVMSLAAIATFASLRAQRNQQRAEKAQADARAELWRAYLSDIRAIRQDKTLGRRSAALDVIRRATAIAPSAKLRNEAVAALALPDFRVETQLAAEPAMAAYGFDRELRFCALSLTNGDVVIRTMNDGKEVARLRMAEGQIPQEQESPSLVEFSPDGRNLSVRYRRGALAVWDWEKGRTIFRHDIDKARRLASRGRFSADGRFIVGPVFAPKDGMAVFELETGRQVAFFPEVSSFHHVAVRPGAPMFAAYDGTNVVVLDWEKRVRVATFPFDAGVRTLSWSADGRRLAIAGNLLEVHVWDFAERQRRVLTGHKNDVWSVAFDPQGDRLATSSFDGTCRLWDLRDGRLIGVTSEGRVVQWSADGRLGFENSNRALEVRRLVASPVHRELVGPANISNARTMDISADGRWAISAAGRDQLLIWKLGSSDGPDSLPVEWLRSLSFHPTEAKLFITKRGGPDSFSYRVVTNGSRTTMALGGPAAMRSVGDRKLDLVTASADARSLAWVELGAGRVWAEDVGSATRPVEMKKVQHSSTADYSSSVRGSGTVSLSADGRWLVCGASGPGVVVFDARTGEKVRELSQREASVQFSPDGRWLVAAERARCRMFRVSDWSQVWEVEQPRIEPSAAAFSPDGALVAVAKSPRAVALIDAATGRELAELQSPDPAPIVTMRWSADGQRLVFATRENHVEVWEPAALRKELTMLGLDWDAPSPGLVTMAPVSAGTGAFWMALGIFATVAPIAIVALLSLRRHRRLIESFTQTEALVAQRERELHGEREIRQLKDSFVSMVSHEFRTPLGIIQSSAQILDRYLDRLPAEQRREQVVSITKNVRRMASLIDEVLVLGKVDAGQLRCSPASLALATFCHKLADEMHSATSGRCPIRLEISELPAAQADEALLRHILGNLISNAVKYSPSGRAVGVRVAREASHALFTVRDEGVGIPLADRDHLFTAFHRGGNVGQISGTGLGLTIVKRCVELHGGEIWFESEEGRGTTFMVRLPLFPPF